MSPNSRKQIGRAIGVHALALVACVYLTLPFVWIMLTSCMTESQATTGAWLPRPFTLENYRPFLSGVIFPPPATAEPGSRTPGAAVGESTATKFPRAIANSLLVAVSVTLINLFIGSLAAYAIARISFGRNLQLLLFYLLSRSVPGVALVIPMYIIIQKVGILDTPLSIILAHTSFTLPFVIWMLKGYFQTLPLDLERAARVDGCNRIQALARIFLPTTIPGLLAAGIFSFISSWGEFLYALLFTTTMRSKTITVLASEFVGEVETPYTLIASGSVLVIAVPLLLAFIFQRYIVHGIGGAVTG